MSNNLLTEDDGLPMRLSGVWAEEKLDYLDRYINVFETSMKDKFPTRFYIDLLAGPGKNQISDTKRIILGSPLLALKTTYPFTHYIFVEQKQENVDALRIRCQTSNLSNNIKIFQGDCNILVDQVISEIRPQDLKSLNLAFLDPEGMELRWQTIEKLASLKRLDLIINYPQGTLNRNMRKSCKVDQETAIDSYFGDTEWRKIYARWCNKTKIFGVHRELIDFYKHKLQDLGYKQVLNDEQTGDEPLMRNARRKAPLYRLIFASKHDLGSDFWGKITRRNLHGQARLL